MPPGGEVAMGQARVVVGRADNRIEVNLDGVVHPNPGVGVGITTVSTSSDATGYEQ